ncbi:MAG: hypothetical protein EON54_14000 [Alcaligenaceae bacterium]|nr:MAG: hypothetical protein EON54_14000 [Alcaligenaceae bacterium]
MAKSSIHPSNTPNNAGNLANLPSEQLADLAALLGLMQSASRISAQLDDLANKVGGSLERIAASFQVPYQEVYNTYVEGLEGKPALRKTATNTAAKPRKYRKAKTA